MKKFILLLLVAFAVFAQDASAQITSTSPNINFGKFLRIRKIGSFWQLERDSTGLGDWGQVQGSGGGGGGGGSWGSITGTLSAQTDLNTAITSAKARSNHTGTQLSSTISDFQSAARTSISAVGPLSYNSGTGAMSLPVTFDTTLAAAPFRIDSVQIAGIWYHRIVLPKADFAAGDSGYITPVQDRHLDSAYNKTIVSGSYNSGTSTVTLTRKDGTTVSITGVTGGGGGGGSGDLVKLKDTTFTSVSQLVFWMQPYTDGTYSSLDITFLGNRQTSAVDNKINAKISHDGVSYINTNVYVKNGSFIANWEVITTMSTTTDGSANGKLTIWEPGNTTKWLTGGIDVDLLQNGGASSNQKFGVYFADPGIFHTIKFYTQDGVASWSGRIVIYGRK